MALHDAPVEKGNDGQATAKDEGTRHDEEGKEGPEGSTRRASHSKQCCQRHWRQTEHLRFPVPPSLP